MHLEVACSDSYARRILQKDKERDIGFERSSLYALPLDSKLSGPGCELCVHRFENSDFVGDIFPTILQHEGVDTMTLGEYLGQEGVD